MPASPDVSDQALLSTDARPVHADLLLQAVLQRDASAASRHLAAWVHRRGVASLDGWMVEELPSLAGDEGFYWLAGLLESPLESPLLCPPAPLPASASASQPPPLAAAAPAPVAQVQPAAAEQLVVTADLSEVAAPPSDAGRDERASRELDRALAELVGAFPGFAGSSLPEPTAVEPGAAKPTAAELIEEAPAPTELPLQTVTMETTVPPAMGAERSPSSAASLLEAVSLSADELIRARPPLDQEQDQDQAEVDAGTEAESEAAAQHGAAFDAPPSDQPLPAAPLALGRWARRSIGRARSLLRDCYEEAIGGLHAESLLPGDETELSAASELMATPQPSAAEREWPEPGAAAPMPPAVSAARPAGPVAVPPAARWDRASAEGNGGTAPQPVEAPTISARLRNPGLFSGRRPSNRPAPAPAALADLRAWLPDADEQPRRAS